MKLLIASALFILIAIAIMQAWLLVACVAVSIYSFRFGTMLLLPLFFVLDGYFGNFYKIPYLSIGGILWFLFVEYVRPRISSVRNTL
ncbi:hypothetical protein KC906_02130 [Candidatus Kaiserbacteria bacterium]|nr:hypothetical protein [Candidatus Kaiserbacteria bacterium]